MNLFIRSSLFVCCIFFSACLVMENTFTKLPPGIWRATLQLQPPDAPSAEKKEDVSIKSFEETASTELPFLMEVKYTDDDNFYIEIINGKERIRADEIKFGRDRSRAMDTIRIDFPLFDSYIRGRFQERVIRGEWVVNYKENYSIPFVAEYGRDFRFTNLKKPPTADLSGKWQATFGLDEEKPYAAVGEFTQNDNQLSGTFLTETGDYRYLDGTVQGDKFYLSCFDGSHAFLFEGKILAADSIVGTFKSGTHYKTTWEAMRNEKAKLADPDSLTFLKDGFEKIEFSFENTEGQMISLDAPQYSGKVKILQIMGTWCPNCLDETNFLLEYLKHDQGSQVAVIGLAFEKYKEKEKAMTALRTYKNRLGIDYELLLAGYANKKEAAEKLPMLNAISSYPTMIFVDKNDKVRRIHTGFSGPATSEFADFKNDFINFVGQLIAE